MAGYFQKNLRTHSPSNCHFNSQCCLGDSATCAKLFLFLFLFFRSGSADMVPHADLSSLAALEAISVFFAASSNIYITISAVSLNTITYLSSHMTNWQFLEFIHFFVRRLESQLFSCCVATNNIHSICISALFPCKQQYLDSCYILLSLVVEGLTTGPRVSSSPLSTTPQFPGVEGTRTKYARWANGCSGRRKLQTLLEGGLYKIAWLQLQEQNLIPKKKEKKKGNIQKFRHFFVGHLETQYQYQIVFTCLQYISVTGVTLFVLSLVVHTYFVLS